MVIGETALSRWDILRIALIEGGALSHVRENLT
jgi:hypothetical protein